MPATAFPDEIPIFHERLEFFSALYLDEKQMHNAQKHIQY